MNTMAKGNPKDFDGAETNHFTVFFPYKAGSQGDKLDTELNHLAAQLKNKGTKKRIRNAESLKTELGEKLEAFLNQSQRA
jgi:hypothetical protein